MKVLINNAHNATFGGGEFYTYQVAKAISTFCDVTFMQTPNEELYKNNPQLRIKHPLIYYSANEHYDYFLDICHFKSIICNSADNNIKVVFFPKEDLKVAEFDEIVSITRYTKKYVEKYWNKDSAVCYPYSYDIKSLEKKEKTIVSIGNFFQEPDGHSKGFHHLIKAFINLSDGYKLTLIGHEVTPHYVRELRELSEGLNVEIITDASEDVKRKTLGESEFYWHANGYQRTDPGQTEHFGIAPEEGLKAGCLTYVFNSGGAREFCSTWNTLEELVRMTETKYKNPVDIEFQTPEGMIEFWKSVII